ncbi:Protein of unknown function [Propionibacterium freudenreichii]|nr:Protein of unknown function [Propionibacterium freudenreichii]
MFFTRTEDVFRVPPQ